MSIDAIGNFLTVIRNAVMVSKPYVVAPYSRMNASIARILKEEGFVNGVETVPAEGFRAGSSFKNLKIVLRYVDGESAIHSIDRVSKPSRRMYSGIKNVKPVIDGLGIAILTTNRGVMTDKQAKSKEVYVGGEVICKVW